MVERYRQTIRRCVALCEQPPGTRAIAPEAFDEEGEVEEKHIFCTVCGEFESWDVSQGQGQGLRAGM